jgi:hypothetical protein
VSREAARGPEADNVALDSTHRVRRASAGELLHVALHGDYRYDALKNTGEETHEQDANLRGAEGRTAQRAPEVARYASAGSRFTSDDRV